MSTFFWRSRRTGALLLSADRLSLRGGGKVDKSRPTQVGRALGQLGIELIPAYSPEVLGKDVYCRIVCPRKAHLGFLQEDCRNTTNPRSRRNAAPLSFVELPGPEDVLCLQEERQVANDNTVRYKRLNLQIPPDKHRFHYVRVKVKVHEYLDGALAVFHGPRLLAQYNAKGELQQTKSKKEAA